MTTLTGKHDEVHTGAVTRVARVFWGRTRAWHGETVKACLRTELVEDGAAAVLAVLAATSGTEVGKVEGKVKDGALDLDYVVNLAGQPLPPGEERLVLKATIGKLISPESPPLAVDLVPPILSL